MSRPLGKEARPGCLLRRWEFWNTAEVLALASASTGRGEWSKLAVQRMHSRALRSVAPEAGSPASSLGITWELVRDAGSCSPGDCFDETPPTPTPCLVILMQPRCENRLLKSPGEIQDLELGMACLARRPLPAISL